MRSLIGMVAVALLVGSVAASEVVEELGPKNDWQPRTIRTLLARLVNKGALRSKFEGKRYLYEPKVTMEECVRHEHEARRPM